MIRPAAKPIHLDTSFLIRALDRTSPESTKLLGWLAERRVIKVSTLAWGELLCGPLVEAEQKLARRVVQRHLPVGVDEATEAARLFSHAGRRRGSFADCVIGATAIVDGARLAISDREDFERFTGAGLELAGPASGADSESGR